jgi:hypothetical protein
LKAFINRQSTVATKHCSNTRKQNCASVQTRNALLDLLCLSDDVTALFRKGHFTEADVNKIIIIIPDQFTVKILHFSLHKTKSSENINEEP